MKTPEARPYHLAAWLAEITAALLLLSPVFAQEQEKKPTIPVKPPATKAAPTKAGVPGTNTPAGGAAPAGRGPATGPTSPTAGRGSTAPGAPTGGGLTPAGRGPTTVGPTGRGPAPGGRERPIVGGRPQPKDVRIEHHPSGDVSRRADGRPRDVHVNNRGMDIHHGLAGGRRVEVERADHSRIVAERGGRGYVQHPYAFHGHEFAYRTYYVNGRAYDRFYGRYQYHGVFLEVYAPVHYYPVGFYGFVYNPWVAPVPYAWGWAGTPWFGYYGAYFTPYPVYANASFWLTDYLISQSLAASYQARVDAQMAMNQPLPPGQPVLTPEVKQAITDEVRRQVALENAEAQANAQNTDFNGQSSGIARMLADNSSHVFVVGGDLDLIDASGQECAVSEGDVLQFNPAVPLTADGANLRVMASKGGLECRRGMAVAVSFTDLQSMQNHMRETLDAGLADLQAHNGSLPAPPPSAMAQATQAGFLATAPAPDPNAAAEINQQLQQADQAEQQTLNEGAGSTPALAPIPPPAAPPATVSLGMTTDQVVAILGQPKNIMDLGARKIYIYPGQKITFKDGKLSDVE
jgi:hypothetical protein